MKTNARQIVILVIVAFIMGQVWLVIPSFYHVIMYHKKVVPEAPYAFIFLPLVISAIVMANIIGHIDYYFGTKRGLLISLILATAGMFLVAIADGGYVYYVLAQICIGAAIAGTMSALSVLSIFILTKRCSSFLLVLFAAMIFGATTIPSLLDYFLKHHTWQEIPLYLGFVSILLYMIVQLFVDDTRSEDHPRPKGALTATWKKIPWTTVLFLLLVLSNTISQVLLQELGGSYLLDIKSVGERSIIFLMTSYFLSMGVGAILAGVIDTFTPTRILYPVLAGLVLLGYLVLPFAEHVYQMFLATCLIGIGVWSILPLTIFYIHRFLPETEEIATSFLISTYFIGVAISSFFQNVHHSAVKDTFHLGLLTAGITLVLSLFIVFRKWSPQKH